MKCKDCEKYIKTSTSEHGVCSLLKDYFPTKAEDECVWIPNKAVLALNLQYSNFH